MAVRARATRRIQEGITQHLGGGAVQQHVALVGLGLHLAREADRIQRSGAVDQDRALTAEALELPDEELAQDVPRLGVRQIRRHVIEVIGAAPADVVDVYGVEGHCLCERQPDPARSARDEDEIPTHGRNARQ